MIVAVRTETRKFFSTRMWWVMLLLMVGYMAFLAAMIAFSFSQAQNVDTTSGEAGLEATPLDLARSVYTIAVSLGYVFPALIGTMAVTGEFRHRTIVPTLLFDPDRTRLLGAKLLGALPVGVLFGLAGVAAAVVPGAAVLALTDQPTLLGEPEVWRSIALAVLALALWTAVGVGIGSVLPNQVAAIVVLLVFTQFVEPLARTILPTISESVGSDVASFLPGSAGEALAQGSLYSAVGVGHVLQWWQGALVLLGYAVLLTGIGRLTTFRRDLG